MAVLKSDNLTFPNGQTMRIFNTTNPVQSTDANDYVDSGVYFCELRSNVAYIGGYYILVVLSSGNGAYKWQIIFNFFANEIYARRYDSGNGWTEWYEIQKTIVSQ